MILHLAEYCVSVLSIFRMFHLIEFYYKIREYFCNMRSLSMDLGSDFQFSHRNKSIRFVTESLYLLPLLSLPFNFSFSSLTLDPYQRTRRLHSNLVGFLHCYFFTQFLCNSFYSLCLCASVCLYWNASNEKFKLKCVATLLGANRNLDI